MTKEPKSQNSDKYSDEETARWRDEGLRRLLKTPPKPHAEITGKGKPECKQPKTGKRPKRPKGERGE